MFAKVLSKITYAVVMIILVVTAHFENTYADGLEPDTIEPSEDDEWEEVDPEPPEYKVPQGVQTLSFNPANLTDEDQHSRHMPRDLLCDGCRIIAYCMTEKLKKIQGRYKKGHKLKESDIVDLMDQVCKDKDKRFETYGIKEINGVRRLSGEGLETKDVPGMLQGGGKWPSRLVEMCLEYIGEIGEDVVYERFLDGQSLENLFCRNPDLGNVCPPKKKRRKTKKDEL